MGLSIWQWVGVGLLLWWLWDLVFGYTYIHRLITRNEEPGLYWGTMLVWLFIAVALFLGIGG